MVWQSRKRTWFGAPWTFTIYSFDEERFYLKKGVLTQTHDEVRLYRITDISYKATLIQRIFGMGTITIKSSDKSLGNFELINVKNVADVKEQLSNFIETQRTAHGVRSREFIGGFDDDDFDDDDHN